MSKNRDLAEKYFVENGLMPPKEKRSEEWVLHHKDITLKDSDPIRYSEWKIEDLIPMTRSEHNRLHNTGELNRNYGKHLSDKHKKAISQGLTGHSTSDETKQRISSSVTGYKHTDEAKEKMSKAKIGKHPWNYGKKGVSDETRMKMSESAKNRPKRHYKVIDGKRYYY